MKKLIQFSCFLIVLIGILFAVNVHADATTIVDSGHCGANGDNLTWTLDNEGTLIINGVGDMYDYDSDSSTPWTSHRNDIIEIVIDGDVNSIGRNVFKNCSALKFITIPNGVRKIGDYAFYNCENLIFAEIPPSVTTIGPKAFYGCSLSFDIYGATDSVAQDYARVNNYTFKVFYRGKCGENVTYSFNGATGVLTISGTGPMMDYSNYKNVPWYDDRNYGIKSVVIESGVTTVGRNAFCYFYNNQLASVTIPDSVVEIKTAAFSGCNSLVSVTIPNSVISIESQAFSRCIGLKSIIIPNSVKYISSDAFSGCNSSLVIYGEKYSYAETFANEYNIAFVAEGTVSSVVDQGICGASVNYTLTSDGVLTISGTGPMMDYSNYKNVPWYDNRHYGIKSVVIESGVTTVGRNAFCDFYNNQLASVIIPDSVVEIKTAAFSGCNSLVSVTIPNSVISIESQAFSRCIGLKSIIIPNSVKYISSDAFSGCNSSLVIYGERYSYAETFANEENISFSATSGMCGEHTIWEYHGDTLIISGSGNMQDYTDASLVPWQLERLNIRKIVIEDGVTRIGSYAFSMHTELNSVILPDSIINIGNCAFYGCQRIEKVIFDGTERVWREVSIGTNNRALRSIIINQFMIAYDLNEGIGDFQVQIKKRDADLVLRATEPVRQGYTFKGWAETVNGNVIYIPGDIYNKNESITLYAIWEIKTYTILYIAEESMNIPENHSKTHGETVTLSKMRPVRAGYFFKGWATSADGEVIYQPGDVYWAEEDVTLYAVYKAIPYTPIKSLKFASTKANVYVGHNLDLYETLTVTPYENSDTLEWTSSDEEIATVDEYGVVTPLATGKVKITATAVAGKKKATVTVTVAREPEGIDVVDTAAVAQGKTITLKAYAFYEENGKTVKTKDAISWESLNEDIATVSKGKIKGISRGTATIRAFIAGSDVYKDIEVNVAVPVKKLKLATTKQTLYVGHAFDLSEGMTVEPFDNTDTIVWTSSNEDIAIVDEYGVVTPFATGKVKITALAEAGKKKATCTVTVAREPEDIIITGDHAVAQGKSLTLKAYACYYEDGDLVKTKDAISWRSEDESIATVSKGKVKGIDAGTVNIVAYIESLGLEVVHEVTVAIPAKSVKLSVKKLTAGVGDTFNMNDYLTTTPDDHTDEITWKTSKASVATVTDDGYVTIVGKGSAKITAKATAGKKSAYVTITVK